MKKITKIIITILLFSPLVVKANTYEYGTYEDAKKYIQEVMAAYYIKGDNLQYNSPRASYGTISPEEATPTDRRYLVCSAYTYSCYAEAFGMKYADDNQFPRYSQDIIDRGREYYINNKDTASKMDGHFLIYYQNTTSDEDAGGSKYVYGTTSTDKTTQYKKLVDTVQPGDVFAFSGHALIAYGTYTNPTTGKKDVLILNSTRKAHMRTIIESSTSKLSFDTSPATTSNGVLDIDKEGTVHYAWLSNIDEFVTKVGDDYELNCTKDECTVIRMFYNDGGNAKFNYYINESNYKKSQLRNNYTGIDISKISDKGDNNTVYVGDTIKYQIKITNKSDMLYANKTYNKFYIEETLDDKVTFVSANNGGSYKNGKITWNISNLQPSNYINLEYTVKVNENYDNINGTIVANGKLYGTDSSVSIGTGKVESKIGVKYNNTNTKTYELCYNDNKSSYSSLELIDKVYDCYMGKNYNLKNFDFDKIMTAPSTAPTMASSDVIKLTYTSENADYLNAILNKYWGGIVQYNINGVLTNNLPRWSKDPTSRNRNINAIDFKDGDVLIYQANANTYTKENGIYAYIYINNKFIGINYNGTSKQRNEYTFQYYLDNYNETEIQSKLYSKYTSSSDRELMEYINYQVLFGKDRYVILRPSLLTKQEVKINVLKEPKVKYNLNDKISLEDGSIQVTYSNGEKETILLSNDNVEISNFDSSKVGKNEITISYKGFTTKLDLDITEKTEEPEKEDTKENTSEKENPKTGAIMSIGFAIGMIILGAISYKKSLKRKLFNK